MKHVYWLRTNVICGRTGPNTDEWDAHELAEGGIGAVLSVNFGAMVERQALAASGIEYYCVPLSDHAPPKPGDLEWCLSALPRAFEAARRSIDAGRAVMVHCRAGKDRTGMFLCYYLCRTEGLSPHEAVEEVKRVRASALTAEGFEALTLEVLYQVTKQC